MKNIIRKFLIVLVIFLLAYNAHSQIDEKKHSSKSKFEKKTFAKKSDVTGTNDYDRPMGPPDPGGGGWPVPTIGGIGILVIGSLMFWSRKAYNELKNE